MSPTAARSAAARSAAARVTAARATVAALLLAVLSSCALSGDEQDAADGLAQALAADPASPSTQDSADCVADAWVGETGTRQLVEDGLLTQDLGVRRRVLVRVLAGRQPVSTGTAEGYAAAWVSCADWDRISLDRKDSGASAEELDEYADCLKEIADDAWEQAIVDTWTGAGSTQAARTVAADRAACEAELGL
jgi:hypothetical protein